MSELPRPPALPRFLSLSNDGIDRLLADIARPARSYLEVASRSPVPH